jgi:DNA repair protein RadC
VSSSLSQNDEPSVIAHAGERVGPADASLLADLALVVGFGRITSRGLSTARRLLGSVKTASGLGQASVEELRLAGALTDREAAMLASALRLGRAVCSTPLRPGERFSNSRDLFLRYRARFLSATREHFFSLQLNSKNQLLREVLVSIGSLSSSVVHPREVFAPAVRDSTAAVIFLHNHPSGDPAPSREDRECTHRLCHAGRILGIRVLDHVVIGFDDYFSFADAGLLGETPAPPLDTM